ncbi:MAG: cell shape determination protein CcmA [SAR116 cluster bacterium]|jgi:cytoskeletal protein CcmA (bactofilin family)|nr:cell shape determination protein CcmA [SAR116 cluster bacterium]RPG97377.1 MAG: polymer-forming cytoskeletal protein [Candidatus Puniceispirillum sp. TMED176]HBP59693.1 cell shape determination protein CcmA [Alphaproteobacteria bacterium]|tara:strand:+ start:12213 stop:12593 length:381 start_codon:yes stop_codon:yes gene_type:complete
MDRSRAIIGADAKFVGTISNVKSIEIEGAVEADLSAEKLSIGATGKFTGQVTSDLVVIGGAYDGIMQAGSIWATETAQIAGEIHYQSLQMDRGAALNCRVVHNWQEPVAVAEATEEPEAVEEATEE